VQRVFLYPQVIILGIALWRRHQHVTEYIIALSIGGALFAGYQYYIQMGGADILPCPASNIASAECSRRYIFEFGYITFPLMSLVSFLTLIVLMMFQKAQK
jgi:disulfide bond formation protein DsbB